MRVLLAVTLLCSSLAFADPPAPAPSDTPLLEEHGGQISIADAAPADAPKVADMDAPGRALLLEAGSIVPFTAVCLDQQEDVSRERSRVRAVNALADAKTNEWLSKPVLISFIVGALVIGAAVGAGVTAYALKQPAK